MAVPQFFRQRALAALVATACLSPFAASAADEDTAASRLHVSGFASIVAGRNIDSPTQPDYAGPSTLGGRACPCYITDWTNGSVYGDDLTFKPESRAGIQLRYNATDKLYFVTQVVTRAVEPKPAVEWAYGSYKLNDNLEVQAGRKRIPLYYYSDFQDVGTAYPWIGTPPELYGWEVTNYNGASVRYKTKLGRINLSSSVFGGKETKKETPYYAMFTEGDTKVTWRNLVGGDLEASRGPLTVRAVYMQAQVDTSNATTEWSDTARLRAFGLAANLDFDDWFVLSEVTRLSRTYDAYRVDAPAYTIGAGYRWGSWTPMLNFAHYEEKSTDHDWYEPAAYQRASLTLRYDINETSSVKVQFDKYKDTTHNFGDDLKALRAAYEMVF
ncbi:porin [Massilia sp. Dwa41.01b]|uniref:porin n=1 Tax=unclassified Massilia TaxID=2609279 RepID=UPI0016011F0C|nr:MULTISPECIES: porin [unclassified Massilia]QNA87888.1 porin [Massilia sp. Dwa41.01b]QNA98793.1 porin [Massilia sp. Se16.2.3]